MITMFLNRDVRQSTLPEASCSHLFSPAGWEPTTGGLRVDLLYGCPLLLEKREID
jgi:hypothetical protein